MIHDAFEVISEAPRPVRGSGADAPRTALEAARLLQAAGHQVCLVSDGGHTCLTDGRPSLVDLP